MDTNLVRGHASVATDSPDDRRQAGAALRREVPRSRQGEWAPPAGRADPVGILIEQGKSRIQELLPIRYGRMRADPLAFLCGAAAVMATDLARTPATGIRMQACGDAHLANFGSYATPEGSPVFDIRVGPQAADHQPRRGRSCRPVFREGRTRARAYRRPILPPAHGGAG